MLRYRKQEHYDHNSNLLALTTVSLALVFIILISLGRPSSEPSALYKSCISQSKRTLNRESASCLRRFKRGSKQARACVDRAKSQRQKRDSSCRKLSPQMLVAPTGAPQVPTIASDALAKPTVIASVGTCTVVNPQTWRGCMENINSGFLNTIEINESFDCSVNNACDVNIINVQGPVTIKAKDGTKARISRSGLYSGPLLNIQGSSKVIFKGIIFDDISSNPCTNCSAPHLSVINSQDILFEDTSFRGSKRVGLILVNSSKVRIVNSEFSDIQGAGLWIPSIFQGKSVSTKGLTVTGSTFSRISQEAIYLTSQGETGNGSVISNNVFSNSSVGILLQDPARYVDILNNKFIDLSSSGSGHGILARTEVDSQPRYITDLKISGNQFSNLAGWGVFRESRRPPQCININIAGNLTSNVKCNNNPQCDALRAIWWSCGGEQPPGSGGGIVPAPEIIKPGNPLPPPEVCRQSSIEIRRDGDRRIISYPRLCDDLGDAKCDPYEREISSGNHPSRAGWRQRICQRVSCSASRKITEKYSCDAGGGLGTGQVEFEIFYFGPNCKREFDAQVCRSGWIQEYKQQVPSSVGWEGYQINCKNPQGCVSCAGGRRTCDKDGGSGCETDVLNDSNNCGECGNKCSFPYGKGQCKNGKCELVSCNPGFVNCNGECKSSCSGNLCTNDSQCKDEWACTTDKCENSKCVHRSPAVGRRSVAEGMFEEVYYCRSIPEPSCGSGYDKIYQGCSGTNSEACQVNCRKREQPPTGSDCSSGRTLCNGMCVDTRSDVNNCGECGKRCSFPNGVSSCKDGTCRLDACNSGYANCDKDESNGCETLSTSGLCPSAPPREPENPGIQPIRCATGQTLCNGKCVDTRSDVNNCGECGKRCSFPNGVSSCKDGTCRLDACNSGYANCDKDESNGCETLSTSGLCPSAPPREPENPGIQPIRCATGQTLCNGKCVDTRSDTNNCGSCGTTCQDSWTCTADSCENSSCVNRAPSIGENSLDGDKYKEIYFCRVLPVPSCPEGYDRMDGGPWCSGTNSEACQITCQARQSCQQRMIESYTECSQDGLLTTRYRYPKGCSYQVACPGGTATYGQETCLGSSCELTCVGSSCLR